MATRSTPCIVDSTPSFKKYTSSFLYQLQAEWDEFMLEISHSTPLDNLDNDNRTKTKTETKIKSNTKEAFVDSLNKFNYASGTNILIPVPLHTLRKLFSPTKPLGNDVVKNEFISEIKENLNLTEIACKKLQKLLLNEESSDEISDFASPSLPKNFRKSAPARLFFKKKKKKSSKSSSSSSSSSSFQENDFLKIVNCFKNDRRDEENRPDDGGGGDRRDNVPQSKVSQSFANVNVNGPNANNIDGNVVVVAFNNYQQNDGKIDAKIPSSRIISQDYVLRLTPPPPPPPPPLSSPSQSANNAKSKGERKTLQSSTIVEKSRDYAKTLSVKKKTAATTTTTTTSKLRASTSKERKNEAEPRYSDIYTLQFSGSGDSSGLFYTFKHPRKNVKPTIVCTYFNQKELTEIYQIVKKLGHFEVENYVSSRTTHLICGGANKTINLCKAVARGCWILDREWIFSSNKENRWLFEERFEKINLSDAIRENRLKRQKFGSQYKCEIFSECGTIYVSKKCIQPNYEDIRELILLGSGRLENFSERATRIVGYVPKREYVKEIWILNCILRGYIVDPNKYVKNK